MAGVVAGFTVIFAIITVGYAVGRSGILGPHGEQVLSRLVFFVAAPALLFDTLSTSSPSAVLSPTLVVAALSALLTAALYFAVARLWLKRAVPEATIGALSSSYVNAMNLGLPVAVYVLGKTTAIAPVLMFQILVFAPIALTIMDLTVPQPEGMRQRSIVATLLTPVKNPILIAATLGLAVAVAGWTLPEQVAQPVHLLGGISVPGALVAFGLSLNGSAVMRRGISPRRDVLLASALKVGVQPLLALVIGGWLLGLGRTDLLAVVVLATLPTAQNVFVYASWYGRGVVLARDTALLSTVAAIPAITFAAWLLA